MERYHGFEQQAQLADVSRHYDRAVPSEAYDVHEALAHIQHDVPDDIAASAEHVLHAAHTFAEQSTCGWKQVYGGIRSTYTYGAGKQVDITTLGSNGAHSLFSTASQFGAEIAPVLIQKEFQDAGIHIPIHTLQELVSAQRTEQNELAFTCMDSFASLQNTPYEGNGGFYCYLSNHRARSAIRPRHNCPSICAEQVAQGLVPYGMMLSELLDLEAITVVGGRQYRQDGAILEYYPCPPEDISRIKQLETIHFNVSRTTTVDFARRYLALKEDSGRMVSNMQIITDVLPCLSCADVFSNGKHQVDGVAYKVPTIISRDISRYHNGIDDGDIASIAWFQTRGVPLYHIGPGRIPHYGRE